MSEFPVSETSKKTEFSSPLVSGFVHFCFYIISHPIYFSYFIFFTPYILKLLTFLTPLFVTCALLLLALLTASPNSVLDKFQSEFSDSKVGFLLSTYQHVLQQFMFKGDSKDEGFGCFAQLEAYKIMLETSIFEGLEPKSEAECSHGFEEEEAAMCPTKVNSKVTLLKASRDNFNLNSFECDRHQEVVNEVKPLESIFQEETESEVDWSEKRVQEVKPLNAELDKVGHKESASTKGGSKVIRKNKNDAQESRYHDNYDDHDDIDMGYASEVKVTSPRLEANIEKPSDNGKHSPKVMGDKKTLSTNLGSFGSMRKEKEWRRTLACKLFEERHNTGGAEGMDMLWETYETESNKVQVKSNKKKGKKGEVEYSEEDEEEEQDVDGKHCCLQALKFSAGKVNLGMGGPNLMKISKALKGFGWLHHVSKNGKKGFR